MHHQEKDKINVYMMPGMAANPSIFEHIELDENIFEIHWLHWVLPDKNDTLADYSKKIIQQITHESPVLIGVSFGGVLVQEISKLIKLEKLIIISSVKQSSEIPKRMQLARDSGMYKYLPFGLLNYLDEIQKLPVGNLIRKRIKLYKQFLSVNDKDYLDWAVKQMLCWDQAEPLKNTIHIHGDKDNVFPIKNINNCITVPNGTHIMIINRYKWFNQNLPNIILN